MLRLRFDCQEMALHSFTLPQCTSGADRPTPVPRPQFEHDVFSLGGTNRFQDIDPLEVLFIDGRIGCRNLRRKRVCAENKIPAHQRPYEVNLKTAGNFAAIRSELRKYWMVTVFI